MKHKICALSRIHISPNLILKKNKKIGATINTIYKRFPRFSFENSFLEKHVFWEKGLQKGQ